MKGKWIVGLAAAATLATGAAAPRQPARAADLPLPQQLTAEQDHKLMLDRLGITEIRRGADGRDPKAPNAANYDEAKGNPYPDLPPVLTLANGKPVTDAKTWWKKRRPELVE